MELSAEKLEKRLARPLRYLPSVTSTNDEALQWLGAGAPEGAVVIADEQREGRGRLGRVWYTPPGVALAVSVVLKPPAAYAHRVSMIGALAVAQMCEDLGIADVGIKWPNDVQIAGRKVSGVLPEASWDQDKLRGVILGMGVNVRVDFAPELAETAINIETALGRTVDRADLLRLLLHHVDHWAGRISGPELFWAWQSRLTTLGQTVTIGEVRGVAESVDADGALTVRTASGQRRRVIAGDVMV